MFRLQIEDFSCITKADVYFGKLTVIVGPQASGKSVLSKLAYFFLDSISDQYESVLEQKSFDHFTERLKARFAEWFPVSAWGSKKFSIFFQLGAYKIKVTRTSYDDSIKDTLRISPSALVKEHYKRSVDLAKSLRQKTARKTSSPYADFEINWEIQFAASRMLQQELGDDFINDQTFIPAGRSFFTTLGRAFMAFDQGRALDPITVKFGRLYSSFHDETRYSRLGSRSLRVDEELSSILGGKIVWEADRPFVQSSDDRLVPFSALSSGQQELLPLIIAMSLLRRSVNRKEIWSHLIYIEEPEAHLFPSAQSTLIQGLASIVSEPSRLLAITTHSPYVLSKINNLIKAGALAESLPAPKLELLDKLVNKRFRLKSNSVRAYAIIGGEVEDIVDSDGLIAADYLDGVSGEIGKEFGELLSLEFGE